MAIIGAVIDKLSEGGGEILHLVVLDVAGGAGLGGIREEDCVREGTLSVT